MNFEIVFELDGCLLEITEEVYPKKKNTVVSVDHRAGKFIIISNDRGRTQKCDFSVLDRKYSFGKFGPKKSKSSV